MKRLIALGILPLLSAGCGSSPVAPTPGATAPAPRMLAVSTQVVPSGVGGFTAPTSLTLQLMSRGFALRFETADLRMLDSQGLTLAQAFITPASAGSADPDQYVSEGTIVRTFRWPAERGVGARIEVVLTYREDDGALKTFSFSVPAR